MVSPAPRWCAWTTHLPSGELFPGLPLLFGHDFLESPSDSYKFPKWGITLETIGDSDLPSYPSLCKETILGPFVGKHFSLNGLREISLGDYFDTCSGGLFINCLRDIFPKWGVESGWDYFSDRVDDAWWDVSWSPHRLHWYAWGRTRSRRRHWMICRANFLGYSLEIRGSSYLKMSMGFRASPIIEILLQIRGGRAHNQLHPNWQLRQRFSQAAHSAHVKSS